MNQIPKQIRLIRYIIFVVMKNIFRSGFTWNIISWMNQSSGAYFSFIMFAQVIHMADIELPPYYTLFAKYKMHPIFIGSFE
jgi:hypothetical protein